MRLFITTGHVLSNVGGPAQYGPKLKEEFENAGHKVRLISYDAVERILPIGLRHIYFFLNKLFILFSVSFDCVIFFKKL